MASDTEFKARPCRHCGAAHGHFHDCLHKYERAIATAPDLGGLWALCNYFAELTATPPADAALADAIKLACNYYRQAGRVGTTSQTLAKQHEAAADKIIAEALRVRAVMDIDGERYRLLRTFNWNDSPICCVADPKASVRLGCDCPSGDRLDEKLDAMLAASKSGGEG